MKIYTETEDDTPEETRKPGAAAMARAEAKASYFDDVPTFNFHKLEFGSIVELKSRGGKIKGVVTKKGYETTKSGVVLLLLGCCYLLIAPEDNPERALKFRVDTKKDFFTARSGKGSLVGTTYRIKITFEK